MTHHDLTELQIEISELEKENQELKERVKDLEVNLTYLTNELSDEQPKAVACGTGTISTTDSVVH